MQSHSSEVERSRRRGHDCRSRCCRCRRPFPEAVMFARLLIQSFLRQRRRKLLAWIAITLGVGVATAMLAVATDVGDRMNRELRSFGANILVTPQDDALDLNLGGVQLKPASDGGY